MTPIRHQEFVAQGASNNMSSILFVDDNPHARRIGREVLGDEGHEVVVLSSGDEAVEYLSSHRPDLVFADTAAPGKSGFEICGLIRSDPRLSEIKVVLLQRPLEEFNSRLAEEVRSNAVLHKPLDAPMLLDAVGSLLDGGRGGDPERSNATFTSVTSDAPEPARPSEHFAAAVEEALTEDSPGGEVREEVRGVVAEVFEAVTPALIDRITERVLQVLRKKGG